MTSFPSEPMRVLYGDLDLTDHPYIFDRDASFGAAENVYEALAGMLADGETVTSDRTSNREVSFVVWVEGQSLGQVEGPGAALDVEADRQRNELTVYPGNGGTPFVLETFRASVEPDRTDARESASMRRFVITAPARPFVRSLEGTLSPIFASPPPPVAPVVVTVDACTSTAGWSASYMTATSVPAGVATVDGYVYTTGWAATFSGPFGQPLTMTRTGSVPLSDTPLLVVEWGRLRQDWSRIWTPPRLAVSANDNAGLAPVATTILDNLWVQSVYDLTAHASAPVLKFIANGLAGAHRLHVRDIKRTDQMPAPRTTGHQVGRTITVGGSARTQALMHLWHDTDPLGDILMHTSSRENGMFSCEPFLTTGTVATSDMVSGTGKSLAMPVIYDVPASLFNPDVSTGYVLMARMRRDGMGAVTTQVTPVVGDPFGSGPVAIGGSEQHTVRPGVMTGQMMVCLGAFNLPPRRVDSQDAAVRVTVTLDNPTGTPILDDLWIVDVETGSLTWINGGLTGAPDEANLLFGHLWVEPATVDAPLPRVRTAHDVEGRFGYEVFPASLGKHDFPPGDVHIYTVATGAPESNIQLEYFERWRTYAGS